MVPHEMGGMTMVECPTECFCDHVRRIHDSRKVNQNDVLHESPMLKCKMFFSQTTGQHVVTLTIGPTVSHLIS